MYFFREYFTITHKRSRVHSATARWTLGIPGRAYNQVMTLGSNDTVTSAAASAIALDCSLISRLVLSFDTSAFTHLAKHRDAESLCSKLNAAYHVRSVETVICELAATEKADVRAHLFEVERRLRSPGDITVPHHSILEESIRLVERLRFSFEWRRLSIRAPQLEARLATAPVDDALSSEQREQFAEAESRWTATFKTLSDSYDAYLPGELPVSLEALVKLFEGPDGALLHAWGKMLYKNQANSEPDLASVRQVYDLCPSFRAMIIAMLVQQWERCFRRVDKGGTSYRAGRNDTIMATYLPYCNLFVCADKRQRELLKKVVLYAKLSDCEILSPSELYDRLTLSVPSDE